MIRIVFTLQRASVVEMTKHCQCLVKISKKVVNFILRMNMNNQTAGQREMRLSSSALQRLFALIFCQTTEWITLYKFVKLLLQRFYQKNTYNIEKKTTAPMQIRTKINARMQLF